MLNPWTQEIWRFIGIVLTAVMAGVIIDAVAVCLLVAVTGYLVWHGIRLYQLERWIRVGNWSNPPDINGVWGEFYAHYYRLRKRSRKRKRKLVAMLNRFQESAAAMPDATIALGERGEISWWNDAARRFLGLKYPHDTGQRIDNLIRHPAFTDYLQAGDYSEPVVFSSPVDEHMMLSVKIVPYGNNQKLLVAQDITRLHRLEQMRRDFVANVSHELKTPLTVVSGFIETMQDSDQGRDSQWERYLQLMNEQTLRMKNIVEDLLFLSKLETKQRRTSDDAVNVPNLIAAIRVEAFALSKQAANHEIVTDVDDSLWLFGDEAELRSAFSNLIVNAVHYSPEGGKIAIKWFRERNQAYLSVVDSGIGIPTDQIPRLTERFYRVDKSRSRQSGGTGLGLAIVKHVLNSHQAELTIESTVGVGSTFTCIFPAARLAGRADMGPKVEPVRLGPRRIPRNSRPAKGSRQN